MRFYIIVASINELSNIREFHFELSSDDVKLIVIDENNRKLRGRNREILSSLPHQFYGIKERRDWFKERFGSAAVKFGQVIPEKCHAETSFGFLVAYEEQADIVIELDDDVFPVKGINILESHTANLLLEDGLTVYSKNGWYNTIENLQLNVKDKIFARGHPYNENVRKENYTWIKNGCKCVLNMGMWIGHPDLDALTVLYYGGLNGRCRIRSFRTKRKKVIVGRGTYIPICSMNTAFKTVVIPAFYQLYMNFMGVDRFDDIWSGIFLKRITDHLGDSISIGEPVVYHNKRSRSVFADLRKEMQGLEINEKLWKTVKDAELTGGTYWDAYRSLINELRKKIPEVFREQFQIKYLDFQLEKMELWLEVIDRIM